jgi:hypothetical protein
MRASSALLIIACSLHTAAATADALPDRDNGPLSGLFGFPQSREGSRLKPAGNDAWEMYVSVSSHSMREMNDGESLLLDGETRRLGLTYRRGISEKLELGLELPWVFHESGSLDSFIDGWHSAFGLPRGIRDERPQDQLLFRYRDADRQFSLNRNTHGLGDVRLLGGWQLGHTRNSSSALRFGVKFPTGDSKRLLGSGSMDLSLGIAGDGRHLIGVESLGGFYRVSVIWLGAPELLAHRDRRVVAQLSAGVGYELNRRTTLALQTLVRSAIYDSAISPLGDVAASLTIGVRLRLPQDYALSLAVGEDVRSGTMPDVTFAISLQKR